DLIAPGSGQVIVEAITNDDIRNNRHGPPAAKPIAPARPAPMPVIQAAAPPTPDALNALQAQQFNETPSLSSAQTSMGNASQIYLQFGAFSVEQTATNLAQKLNGQIDQVETRPAQV